MPAADDVGRLNLSDIGRIRTWHPIIRAPRPEDLAMSVSLYDLSVPVFIQTLTQLRSILQKGLAHAETRKFDGAVLANSRLFPDMLPLTRQVQIASDAAKGAAARLSGTEPPKYEDNETTLPELIARIDKTLDFLKGFKREQFEGAQTRTIHIKNPRSEHTFPGLIFLRHWALPNFFFHVTMTYALLREAGVELGKSDYLGKVDG